MAIVKGFLQMTGSIKGVSFYTVRGSDQVIMRTKGGANKEQMSKSPKFAGLRKQQKEWSGCTKFASVVRYAFGGLHRLADYNLTPVLNGMGKNIQKLDVVSEVGKRSVQLSQCKLALEGFNFNRNYPFNTVLRVGVNFQLDRASLLATVSVPRINTEIDLLNIQRLPYFRLIVAIGTVSDMIYNADIEDYSPLVPDLHGSTETLTGEWHSADTILPEQTIIVKMTEDQQALLTDEVSVLLSMAVEFGKVGFAGQTVEVKYAGCGKVLCVK